MSGRKEMVVTRAQLAQGKVELKPNMSYRLMVQRIEVHVVEMPTKAVEFFNLKSPVPMPHGVVPSLATAFEKLSGVSSPGALVASHTTGASPQAKKLCERRARFVWELFAGRPWGADTADAARVVDWQQILGWVSETFGFACAVTSPRGVADQASIDALATFRLECADRFGTTVPSGPKLPVAEDWQTFGMLYRKTIAERLGTGLVDLDTLSKTLVPLAGGVLNCASRWVKPGRIHKYAPQAEDRLELLLFPEEAYPLIEQERKPGESIYDEPNYTSAALAFAADPIEIPGREPVEPGPPRAELYEAYKDLHKQAWGALSDGSIDLYDQLYEQRGQAWSDYIAMSGSEAGKLHEEKPLEPMYMDYLGVNIQFIAHAGNLGQDDYDETYMELLESRDEIWNGYLDQGGTGVRVHDDDAPLEVEGKFDVALALLTEKTQPVFLADGGSSTLFGTRPVFNVSVKRKPDTKLSDGLSSVQMRVFFDEELVHDELFSEGPMSELGEHAWSWEGLSHQNGVFSSADFAKTKVKVTATARHHPLLPGTVGEIEVEAKAKHPWIDINVDRNKKKVDVFLRFGLTFNRRSASPIAKGGGRESPSVADILQVSAKLGPMFAQGIRDYWSRTGLQIDSELFDVQAHVELMSQSRLDCLDFDLHWSDSKEYMRSHNFGLIDGQVYYNYGHFDSEAAANRRFLYTCAHEFGHTVLEESRGRQFSWTHKGSTTLVQTTHSASPKYPATPNKIDMMLYYDEDSPTDFYARVEATTQDLLRLLSLAQVVFE